MASTAIAFTGRLLLLLPRKCRRCRCRRVGSGSGNIRRPTGHHRQASNKKLHREALPAMPRQRFYRYTYMHRHTEHSPEDREGGATSCVVSYLAVCWKHIHCYLSEGQQRCPGEAIHAFFSRAEPLEGDTESSGVVSLWWYLFLHDVSPLREVKI